MKDQLVWDDIRKLRGDTFGYVKYLATFHIVLAPDATSYYPNDIASPQGYCLGDNRTRGPSQGAYEEAALTVFTMLDE